MRKFITLIDHSKEQLKLMQDILRGAGYETFCISDETEVFSHLKKYPPHIIIIDFLTSKIDGVDLLAKIREVDYLKQIPGWMLKV